MNIQAGAFIAALVVALLCTVQPRSAVAAQQPQYTVVDLGRTDRPGAGVQWRELVPNQDFSGAQFIPSLGGDPAGNEVFAWFQDFRLPGYSGEQRVAVGSSPISTDGPPSTHAVLWQGTVHIVATDLGVLPGAFGEPSSGPNSVAHALNALGDVVGCSDSQYGTYHPGSPYDSSHAFSWNGGVMHDLGTLATPEYDSCADGVNDSREVVGWTNTISSVDGSVLQRAFVYIAGKMYNLSFFLSNSSTIRLTEALAINCQGNIAAVGYDSKNGVTQTHTYLLNRVGAQRSCP